MMCFGVIRFRDRLLGSEFDIFGIGHFWRWTFMKLDIFEGGHFWNWTFLKLDIYEIGPFRLAIYVLDIYVLDIITCYPPELSNFAIIQKCFLKILHSRRGAKIKEFTLDQNLLHSPSSNLVQINSYIKMIHLRHVRRAKSGRELSYFDFWIGF